MGNGLKMQIKELQEMWFLSFPSALFCYNLNNFNGILE